MSTGLKYLSITTCLLFIVIGCATKYQGSNGLDTNEAGELQSSSTHDAGLDTFEDDNQKAAGNVTDSEGAGLEQHNFDENGALDSSVSGYSDGALVPTTAQQMGPNAYIQSAQAPHDDDDYYDDYYDDDDDDDDHDDDDDDDDDHGPGHDDDDDDDDDHGPGHDDDDDDDDDHGPGHDDDDDDDDDDDIANYFSDSANYRILTFYGSTTEIELADYLVPGVTGITFELVSCDSARADYYDTVRVANGKLVLTSNTLGHVHGANTQTETVCTVVGRGRAGSHRREFQLYTVSDRKPLALASNNVSMEAVRATEVDIQITTSGPGNYVRLGWRKTGSRPTFGVASLTNSPATLTISNLEPATNYEIRVYSMTRQAFDLYRGGNSGSAGSLISEISPASKWISNLSGGGLGSSLTLAVTTAAVNPQGNRAPVAVGTIPAQTVDVGSTVPVSLDGYFSDPDSDTLTYTATSLYISRATVSVSGSALTINGIATGIARIAVTATDPSGLTAPQEFIVTVNSVTVNAQGNRSPTSDTSNEQQGSLRVDVNDDGVVDIADMLLVAEQLGVSGPTNADINVDGIVDAQDLLLVANAFGPVDAP